jgi:DNA-binding transcriptional MerR regulator
MIATAAETELISAGPVARELEIAVETLRLWERTGKIPVARRSTDGRRLYTREEVEAIRAIRADLAAARDARQVGARVG